MQNYKKNPTLPNFVGFFSIFSSNQLLELVHTFHHIFHLFLCHTGTDREGEFGSSKELGDGEGQLLEVPGLTRIAFLFMRSNGIMDDGADSAFLKIVMQSIAQRLNSLPFRGELG